MDAEMSYDAELLAGMIDSGQVVPKALAQRTGYSVQSISDYRSGKRTIPVRFWREVFRITRNVQVLELLTGELPIEVAFYDCVRDIGSNTQLLTEVIQAVGEFHERQKFLIDMIKDGRIDEADRKTFDDYNRSFLAGLQHEREIRRAIVAQFAALDRKECA